MVEAEGEEVEAQAGEDASVETGETQSETVAEEGQESGGCLSLLVVFGVLGVVGVGVKRKKVWVSDFAKL